MIPIYGMKGKLTALEAAEGQIKRQHKQVLSKQGDLNKVSLKHFYLKQ